MYAVEQGPIASHLHVFVTIDRPGKPKHFPNTAAHEALHPRQIVHHEQVQDLHCVMRQGELRVHSMHADPTSKWTHNVKLFMTASKHPPAKATAIEGHP
jgi:hypothetical protein